MTLRRLRLLVAEGSPDEAAAALQESGEEKSTDSFKGRVTRHGNNLIAEDHESIREMSRQALLGMGYRVLPACDGHEALELCSHETPALAILDVIMPKLGGPAAASRLLKMFPRLPVVFTS